MSRQFDGAFYYKYPKSALMLDVEPYFPNGLNIIENDIILEINGEHIDEEHPLGNLIGKYDVGTEITLKIWHKGEEKEVKVELEERK